MRKSMRDALWTFQCAMEDGRGDAAAAEALWRAMRSMPGGWSALADDPADKPGVADSATTPMPLLGVLVQDLLHRTDATNPGAWAVGDALAIFRAGLRERGGLAAVVCADAYGQATCSTDTTDNAPKLAAVVAAQGDALEGLRLALEEERRERLALDRDVRTIEAVLMEERQARTGGDGWLVEPVRVTITAFPDALTPHVSMVQWANDPFETWWCAMWPVVSKLPAVQVEVGQRVGVRPDGRLEVVP